MPTMLRLNARQRGLLADKLLDTANLASAGLIFGQFVGNQSFSYRIAFIGVVAWFALVVCGVALARED